MLINTKDEQKKWGQILTFDTEAQAAVSIIQQPLDDTQGLPFCYLFEGCWIELNLIPEIHGANKDGSSQLWQAVIYFGTPCKTAIAVGTYSNRIEVALKAEQLIKKWKNFKNQAVA